jgi:sirohydrochlorin ferrochelatase
MTTLVVAAHGSRDPRSAANTHAVAERVRRIRRGLDIQVAFLERSTPNLRDVLAALSRDVVVAPLLLADAYHALVEPSRTHRQFRCAASGPGRYPR